MSGSSQSSALAEAAEIAPIVVAVGVAGVIGIIYRAAATGLRITFFSRRDLAGRLDRLACGVTGEYVTSLFGPPVFRRYVSEIRGGPAEVSERIYRTRHAWVQAIVSDGDDAVQCSSITVTDPKFRFRIRRLIFGSLDIRPGAARFGDVSDSHDGWRSVTGARRFAYAESHYFGNPGAYQAYVLAFNDATGIGRYDAVPRRPGAALRRTAERRKRIQSAVLEPLPGWLQPARDQTTVNTLTVLGAGTQPNLATLQAWTAIGSGCYATRVGSGEPVVGLA